MGIMANSKSQSNDNWGMGLLLVFFRESNSSAAATSTTAFLDKVSSFNSSSSSPSSSSSTPNSYSTTKTIKRTNSNNPILTKTQSTISICALLLFLTLLLFTLSTFEPTAPKIPRRFLPEKHAGGGSNSNHSWFSGSGGRNRNRTEFPLSFALQGLGKLYSRGTRAMNDLIVGHVAEDTTEDEFKLFLRLLHRSGLTAKADTVLIFDSASTESRFEGLIREENESFVKLVHLYKKLNRTSHDSVSAARFDVTQFVKNVKEMAEPLWGKRIRLFNNNNDNNNNTDTDLQVESNRLSYGSVVGFEASELDPENSLSGFLDHVPMSLKRWACYPMLLGRVRRNFKHIMLVDVKKLLLLSDPLGRVRTHSPESVSISTKQETTTNKHGKRNSDKIVVNSAILMGGTRGIRRFSSAMLTEIVRVAMQQQHKKKSSITETGILSQLVGNGHILKNIELVSSGEAIPEASSKGWTRHKIIQRGNYEFNSVIMKHICSSEIDSSVYRDCKLVLE